MKINVIESFIDKETGESYNSGALYESTNKDRINELREGGFLAVPEIKKEVEGSAANNGEEPKADGAANPAGK